MSSSENYIYHYLCYNRIYLTSNSFGTYLGIPLSFLNNKVLYAKHQGLFDQVRHLPLDQYVDLVKSLK
jgi:hypothetical protein